MAVGQDTERDPAAWLAADMKQRAHEWSYVLSETDIAEIEGALAACQARQAIQVSSLYLAGDAVMQEAWVALTQLRLLFEA